MAAIAKELDNRKEGDRKACPTCNPKRDRVREDQVWAWSLVYGESPWRS